MPGFSITATVLKQNSFTLYLFKLKSSVLNSIAYVTPRSAGDPQEVQRIVNNIRAKEIGEYIKNTENSLPNSIVLNLNSEVIIGPVTQDNKVAITFPDGERKYAYVLDGQHRLRGFDYSDGIEFDLPVVAYHNLSTDQRGKIFADINSKQVKVTDTHVLSLYYQIRALPPDQAGAMDVVKKLNEDPNSPLLNRIKFRDDERDRWATNKKLRDFVLPYVRTGGTLAAKSPNEQSRIFIEYLLAVQESWSTAWGNNGDYMLTKPMGLEIIFGIFEKVKNRVDLNEGRSYTKDRFTNMLKPLVDYDLTLPGGGVTRLDWAVGKLGTLSNRLGRRHIIQQLSQTLVAAD